MSSYQVVSLMPVQSPIHGTLTLPGSKSMTNRAFIMAAAAEGSSYLQGVLECDDSFWCRRALAQLGVVFLEEKNGVHVMGRGSWAQAQEALFLGSAGTVARFLTSVLALSTSFPVFLQASQQLMKRPMEPLLNALSSLGARFSYDAVSSHFPLVVLPKKNSVDGITQICLSGAISSQFVSGLLMGLPFLEHDTEVIVEDELVQPAYVEMTITMMRAFGIKVDSSSAMDRIKIFSGSYKPTDYVIEADASTASYFLALAAVTGGSVFLKNMNSKMQQPDIEFLKLLKQMGCNVEFTNHGVRLEGPLRLKGGFSVNMKNYSDVALTLAAIAPFADEPIEICGVEHIRHHESDRLSVMVTSLTQLGIRVKESHDGLRIEPGIPTMGRVDSHEDHRVAMSLAILGLAGSGIEIMNPECVSKTCPQFFQMLKTLGITLTFF